MCQDHIERFANNAYPQDWNVFYKNKKNQFLNSEYFGATDFALWIT